jgi:hypothetical protein
MGVLTVYDTVGIQNYIFASDKLAENVGGSKLVADIFNLLLPEIIASVTGENPPDWRGGCKLNPALQVEIIYQSGGNAYIAFHSEPTFQAVTRAFLVKVNQTAPGVGVAVAAIKTDFGEAYITDFDNLNKRLIAVKGSFNTPAFAGNQPITKQSAKTGLPVSVFRDGEYLSISQAKNRGRYAEYKKETESGVEDFGDLAFDKSSNSFIAIVHAEGNNMGKHVKTFMKQFATYDKAVPEIRKLLVRIDNCYKFARERTMTAFGTAYTEYITSLSTKYPAKKFKSEPPILELIGDGDDTTLVIGGKFALDFAAKLLREIEATPVDERPFADITPTACAGVVLFRDHCLFSESYKLAEELCLSAKKPSRENEGSYIDFHLHQSGNVMGLKRLRERQYKVDRSTILCRPWRVSVDFSNMFPNFKWFENKLAIIAKMPRNKTKSIKNAIGISETAADIAVNQMRRDELPDFPFEIGPSTSKYAPYFDILEMYDTYENLLNKEVGSNA